MLSHNSLYPGLQDLILSDYLYIEKSRRMIELFCGLEQDPRYGSANVYLLLRPYGFGLSLAARAVEKLAENTQTFLDKLSLDEQTLRLPPHHVLTLDFKNFSAHTPGEFADQLIFRLQNLYWSKHIESHASSYETPKSFFANLINAVSQKHRESGVIVINNYDLPVMTAAAMDESCRHEALASYLDMLNAIKHAGDKICWCLLTGHLKFPLASEISEGLPLVNDISSDPRFETLFGLTREDVSQLFGEKIREISERLRIDPGDYLNALESSYGGFRFSDNLVRVMCSACVGHAVANNGALYPYTANVRYDFLSGLMRRKTNLKWLFDKDGQDPLFNWTLDLEPSGKQLGAVLVQLGFAVRNKLTLHQYDAYSTWRYRFDYPNEDMRRTLMLISGQADPGLANRPFTPEELMEIDETRRFLNGEDVYELLKEEAL